MIVEIDTELKTITVKSVASVKISELEEILNINNVRDYNIYLSYNWTYADTRVYSGIGGNTGTDITNIISTPTF